MRISVPSYVVPGTYHENLQFLRDKSRIADVELLFFLYDDETDRLFLKEKPDITRCTERFGFSVHLPDEVTSNTRRIVEITADLAENYIVHEPKECTHTFAETVERFRSDYGDLFFLENLIGRNFDSAAEMLPEMPVCMDTGHLLARGESPAAFADTYGTRIKEIHLHGVLGNKDHVPFEPHDQWFVDLVPFLKQFQGKVNIELFDYPEVERVLDALIQSNLLE